MAGPWGYTSNPYFDPRFGPAAPPVLPVPPTAAAPGFLESLANTFGNFRLPAVDIPAAFQRPRLDTEGVAAGLPTSLRRTAAPGTPGQQWAQKVAAAPQMGGETDLGFWLRDSANQAFSNFVNNGPPLVGDLVRGAAQMGRTMFDSPNDRLERAFAAMIGQESGGRQFDKNGRPLTSKAGAIGIAQVMPGTAPEAARLAGLAWDPERYRNDPVYNRALGWAYFQQKYKETGDLKKAVAAYNAGKGNVDRAEARAAKSGNPWETHLPSETQDYLGKVQMRMGELAGDWGAPPPDLMGTLKGTQAETNNWLQQAYEASTQPTTFSYTEAAAPERPAPTPFENPNFAAGDAAFEATRPTMPFEGAEGEKQKLKELRRGYFQGMAQALASLGEGAGVGKILAQLGAGALMGRGAAQADIDAKMDRYDDLMVEYNRALANREDGKATTIANTLNNNITQDNNYAQAKFGDALAQWARNNQIVMDGQGNISARTSSVDENGNTIITLNNVPNKAAALAAHAGRMAQSAQAFGGQAMELQQWQYQTQQSMAQNALTMIMKQGTPAQQAEAFSLGVATRVSDMVEDGTWRKVIPQEMQNQADQEMLGITQGVPYEMLDAGQQEAAKEYVKRELGFYFMSNPRAAMNLFTNPYTVNATLNRRAGQFVRKAPTEKDVQPLGE